MLQNSTVRNTVRLCVYFPVDVCEVVARKKSPFIPPRGMRFNDTKTYLFLGKRGLDSLIQHCQLRPDHKVLDVGCGTGSMALPLTDYLTNGSYEGFDIVPSWIAWCQRHITRRNPLFRFVFVDVYSKHYNSSGKLTAETLKFPYDEGVFDCVLLMSIFTHMLPTGIRNYIHELSRVMKTGGHAFITTFLLNEESTAAINDGRSAISFQHSLDGCLIIDKIFPESAIAVPERQLLAWFSEAGLRVTNTMYGSWAGRKGRENLHDDVVVQKL
jgi:cyclopropane fatty-acyl-phospholipid synthase-like methyltransferase